MIDRHTRQYVRDRAGNRCEYCLLSQHLSPVARLQIEHIVPIKHGGGDEYENLAMACIDCNLAKSVNLTGRDPKTNQTVELFNPRLQSWSDHFVRNGPMIVGLTPTGRTTVRVLNMNAEDRVRIRMVADDVPEF